MLTVVDLFVREGGQERLPLSPLPPLLAAATTTTPTTAITTSITAATVKATGGGGGGGGIGECGLVEAGRALRGDEGARRDAKCKSKCTS